MNKLIRQFEPCHIGNGWGNYIDIENFKYDLSSMRPLPLVKKDIHIYNNVIDIDKNDKNDKNNNKNNNKNSNKAITNLIIRISSTTFVTVVFACFIYSSL